MQDFELAEGRMRHVFESLGYYRPLPCKNDFLIEHWSNVSKARCRRLASSLRLCSEVRRNRGVKSEIINRRVGLLIHLIS